MELSDEQRKKTIKFIKQYVKTKSNCRVGWALKQVAGYKYEKSTHNIEKIANAIIRSKKYIKEKPLDDKNDFNILINPEYRAMRFNQGTIIINLIIVLIMAILGLLQILGYKC